MLRLRRDVQVVGRTLTFQEYFLITHLLFSNLWRFCNNELMVKMLVFNQASIFNVLVTNYYLSRLLCDFVSLQSIYQVAQNSISRYLAMGLKFISIISVSFS